MCRCTKHIYMDKPRAELWSRLGAPGAAAAGTCEHGPTKRTETRGRAIVRLDRRAPNRQPDDHLRPGRFGTVHPDCQPAAPVLCGAHRWRGGSPTVSRREYDEIQLDRPPPLGTEPGHWCAPACDLRVRPDQ